MAFLNWPIKTYFFENLVIGDVACTTLRHTTMFTYSHANTPLGQSERMYYLSYFIHIDNITRGMNFTSNTNPLHIWFRDKAFVTLVIHSSPPLFFISFHNY